MFIDESESLVIFGGMNDQGFHPGQPKYMRFNQNTVQSIVTEEKINCQMKAEEKKSLAILNEKKNFYMLFEQYKLKNKDDFEISGLDFDEVWENKDLFIKKIMENQKIKKQKNIERVQDFVSFLPLPNMFSMKDVQKKKQMTMASFNELSYY